MSSFHVYVFDIGTHMYINFVAEFGYLPCSDITSALCHTKIKPYYRNDCILVNWRKLCWFVMISNREQLMRWNHCGLKPVLQCGVNSCGLRRNYLQFCVMIVITLEDEDELTLWNLDTVSTCMINFVYMECVWPRIWCAKNDELLETVTKRSTLRTVNIIGISIWHCKRTIATIFLYSLMDAEDMWNKKSVLSSKTGSVTSLRIQPNIWLPIRVACVCVCIWIYWCCFMTYVLF